MTNDAAAIDRTISTLRGRLLALRTAGGYWEGHLASSALSTATATVALSLDERVSGRSHRHLTGAAAGWLVANQNHDGGWGDTVVSASNLSTTLLCWAALSPRYGPAEGDHGAAEAGHYVQPVARQAVDRAERWIAGRAGNLRPDTLSDAILAAYGTDRTFSTPILAVLALTGKLGDPPECWRFVPQLPFELAACPHRWFEWLNLPVVSYALPALVAIGQVRHHHKPTRNAALALVRTSLQTKTREITQRMQPESGGYLEATPLTAFVVMSFLASAGAGEPIVERGVQFLRASARSDGSWPIDTNLATWVTTLSVRALALSGAFVDCDKTPIARWLVQQQVRQEHPFTHAKPGGWAWTDLTGGVPDADDTAGALVALRLLGSEEQRDAAAAGIDWLLNLQNRDGGIPTFCRGWGALPFDHSAPDLTAHALQAWAEWHSAMDPKRQRRIADAGQRASAYLRRCQREDGTWIPLWFGNEQMPDHTNPTYGTACVLDALAAPLAQWTGTNGLRERGANWLLRTQNGDGGWGAGATPSTIEETGVALHALALSSQIRGVQASVVRGAQWLVRATDEGQHTVAAPIGLYFARLWYYEELYPLVFALRGLAAARSGHWNNGG